MPIRKVYASERNYSRVHFTAAAAEQPRKESSTPRHANTKPVYVGLLGSTNVGKSTLINSVLGHKVLPAKGDGRSTTSRPIELAWNPALSPEGDSDSARSPYVVTVHLTSKEAWVSYRVQTMQVCCRSGAQPRSVCDELAALFQSPAQLLDLGCHHAFPLLMSQLCALSLCSTACRNGLAPS